MAEARKVCIDPHIFSDASGIPCNQCARIAKAITESEERGRKAGLEQVIKAIEDLRIVAILDQHDVSDEDAQYAGEIHNQSIDKVLSTLRSLSKPEVGG